MTPELQNLRDEVDRLKVQVESLTSTFFLNNFPSSQDFNKYCRFNTTLKVPHYATAPATTAVGEIIEVGGKLYISTAVNTWTVVGTQS